MLHPSLTHIPLELLAEILGLLDAACLLLCSSALKALHKHRRAWSMLKWTSTTVVKIEPLISLVPGCEYDLVGGMFVQQHAGRLALISLPTMVDDPENARADFVIEDALPDIRFFAIEPTLNLIVFFNETPGEMARLELRTMMSQEPHPLAAKTRFYMPTSEAPVSIQIADDVIACFSRQPPSRLVLLNWRLGIVLEDLDLDDCIDDFILLSPRSFILAHIHDDRVGTIDILAFNGRCLSAVENVATLLLPELVPLAYVSSMSVQAGPFCAGAPLGEAPFSKSNDRRLYMFRVSYSHETYFRLFIHGRWLQRFVQDHLRGKNQAVPVMFWDEWGPQNSRMLRGGDYHGDRVYPDDPHPIIRQIFGERVVILGENPDLLEILDFGTTSPRPADIQPWSALHLEPSSLSFDRFFSGPVRTALTYTSTTVDAKAQDLFLIDEDRLVALNIGSTASTAGSSRPCHQLTVCAP
ncbi:hypothetical protein C8R47DRAFT_1317170 [Mycena vitilis]|nr:hypothetical protein C8R47DRAFT_1317170 [Mycena vitilis]